MENWYIIDTGGFNFEITRHLIPSQQVDGPFSTFEAAEASLNRLNTELTKYYEEYAQHAEWELVDVNPHL